ncbi:hypothetical protein [Micromonospora sp. LOL_023]|uniref:hypothetical protein n=1 Tax=Micromonospora sp. LOL_023 TaxID=3345418 RepID=UPI003A89C252
MDDQVCALWWDEPLPHRVRWRAEGGGGIVQVTDQFSDAAQRGVGIEQVEPVRPGHHPGT